MSENKTWWDDIIQWATAAGLDAVLVQKVKDDLLDTLPSGLSSVANR